jgi:predicted ATPase
MDRLERISIKGFRRLQQVDIEMRDLVVMIGANGSGKTSFLDVLSLLSASAKGDLTETLQRKGGLNQILTRGKNSHIEIAISIYKTLETLPLKYELVLLPIRTAHEIMKESLFRRIPSVYNNSRGLDIKYLINSRGVDIKYYHQNGVDFLKPTWEHNPLETSLSQVPKMNLEEEELRKNLANCVYYGALDIAESSPIRLPQAMRPAKLPGANGESLVSCLYYLRETDLERFEMIEDVLSTAFSDFERLNFPPVAAGTISMTWKDKNFSEPMYVHELSEGTLRFLWLATLLLSQDLPTITLLDEPEVSLHPELLRHLVYLMREAAKHTQLIVATHSDRLIRFLDPKEVLICDLDEEGAAKMTWADTLDLDKWLEDYSLDQLWAMNLIGGRP